MRRRPAQRWDIAQPAERSAMAWWQENAARRPHGAAERVVVVGWDCASPWLVFERFHPVMPRLGALMTRGIFGALRSCHPPITVPAWRVMASGEDAGRQGVYGFRNRTGYGSTTLEIARSGSFQGQPLWERLGAAGLRTTLIGLPGTWPPGPMAGCCVAGPLTPDLDDGCAWPKELARYIGREHPRYTFDIADHRLAEPDALLQAVGWMTDARFDLALDLASRDDWNLLWIVEIGLDRLHHALWHHIDPRHPRFVPGSPHADALRDYHARLDRHLGALVDALDDGETSFLVVSDHGARPMEGGFHLNAWLRDQGYLALKPGAPRHIGPEHIDWSRTRVWSMGGYCGRLFFNVAGREPQGIVPPDGVEALTTTLKHALAQLRRPDGALLGVEAFTPRELWDEARGVPPDLILYLGELGWRALETLPDPPGQLFAQANDTGPDSANHDWDGILVAAGAGITGHGRVEQARLLDIAPLIERLLLGR